MKILIEKDFEIVWTENIKILLQLLAIKSHPFVMKEFEYPTKIVKFGKHLTLDGLRRYLKRYCVIAKVLVTTDEPVFGFKDERLIFPVGTFQVTLNTRELEYGLKKNFIRGIYEYAVYEKASIFSDYVTYFNLLKEEYTRQGNRVMRWLTKLLLNSLYGKFGQRNERITFNTYDDFFDTFVSKYIDLVHNREGTLYCFAGKQFLRFRGDEPSFDSFIAIAAEVTANARMHLWNLMQRAGLENVYYVDTDSLFVNEQGYKNLESEIDEVKLGKLKLEGIADRMLIRNVKDYVFNDAEKIKGVKKGSKKISDEEFECLRFYKFRTLLRKGNLSQPVSEYFIKQLKREYKKGKVLDDGRVIPFSLPHECV